MSLCPYRIRSVDTWVRAREDYLAGMTAEAVCARHDLGLSAFRRRARKFGWRRSDQVEPPPDETNLALYNDISTGEQIETARLRFIQALETGKATEARRWHRLQQELIEARDAFETELFRGTSPEQYEALAAIAAARKDKEDLKEEALLTSTPPPPLLSSN